MNSALGIVSLELREGDVASSTGNTWRLGDSWRCLCTVILSKSSTGMQVLSTTVRKKLIALCQHFVVFSAETLNRFSFSRKLEGHLSLSSTLNYTLLRP